MKGITHLVPHLSKSQDRTRRESERTRTSRETQALVLTGVKVCKSNILIPLEASARVIYGGIECVSVSK